MAVRRTGIGAPASFFSFQDILFCCLGIMVLMSAVMTLLMRPVTQTLASAASAATTPVGRSVEVSHRIEGLQRELQRLNEARNRDLDAELAELRQRLQDDGQALQVSVDRLQRLVDNVKAKRRNDPLDPEALAALQLLEQRDELSRKLQEMESRRRLVFLQRGAAKPTRVFEISGSRIVEAMAQGESGALVHPIAGPKPGAELLAERMGEARQSGQGVLLAVKPSGRGVLDALLEMAVARRVNLDRVGREPIPEDRWISDNAPGAGGGDVR